jgi:polyvinyl alcohol dehydrogenase (cytochrome)
LRWVKQLARTGEIGSSGFSSSPILRTLASGNQIILAGQRSGVVYALDPDHGGEILWQTGAPPPGASIAWGMAADYKSVYVGLNGAGSLSAIDLKTGVARWQAAAPTPACAWSEGTCAHGQSQAITVMPGSAFSGSLDGHLRAYSTIDGKVLWDFDTAQALHPMNGIAARGGALDRGGATIVNGMVYINSGNALLAFSTGSP